MAVLHISEADAIRDPAALFNHIRAGFEVVIEDGDSALAILVPSANELGVPGRDHDAWFRAEVQRGLDSDSATDIEEDVAEAHFAERRHALLDSLAKAS